MSGDDRRLSRVEERTDSALAQIKELQRQISELKREVERLKRA